MEAFVEERIAAIEAAGGVDPDEVPPPPPAAPVDDQAGDDAEEPPPPPDYPPGWLEDSVEAAMEAFVEERIAAIEAAGGVDPDEVPPPPPARPDEEVSPPCAYRMAGGADYLKVNAVVCDISQPFTVTGGKIDRPVHPERRQSAGRRHVHVQR